jgi:hypothetical protein
MIMKSKLAKIGAFVALLSVSAAAFASTSCCESMECCWKMICCF